jgi:hypothetical protein
MPPSSLTQNVDWDTDDPEDFLVGKPPIGYTDHEAPAEETVVDLDYAQADETAALMDELVQNLAGSLLKAAAKLPEEATALLRDGESGYLYDFDEYPVLADRLCKLFADDTLCLQFSERVRVDAAARHNQEVNYNTLKSIYCEILEEDSHGSV